MVGTDFLDETLKIVTIKGKFDELDFILQNLKLLFVKDTVEKMTRKATDWKKKITTHVSRIYHNYF